MKLKKEEDKLKREINNNHSKQVTSNKKPDYN